MQLAGKVAIVTGGAKGIGYAGNAMLTMVESMMIIKIPMVTVINTRHFDSNPRGAGILSVSSLISSLPFRIEPSDCTSI